MIIRSKFAIVNLAAMILAGTAVAQQPNQTTTPSLRLAQICRCDRWE
jgi:hypothetical protein